MAEPKLPKHLKGKTPHEITNYIMGGIVREPEPETIGEFFSRLARAREEAAVRALLERARRHDPDPTSPIKL